MNHCNAIGATGGILAIVVALTSASAQAAEKGRFRGHAVLYDTQFLEIKTPEAHPAKSVMQGELEGAIFNDERKGFLDKALYQVHWVGDGTGYSYCFKTFTVKDGDKVFARCESKGMVNGAEEGTVTLIGGTGRYNGIKGKGSYRFTDIAGKVHWDLVEFDYETP
jgi:hypothetical protein